MVREFGGPDSVRIEEVAAPGAPGPGQVLVKLEAAALNNSDLQATRGSYSPGRTLPFRFGQDGAGVVEAVGAGVTSLSAGDRVTGHVSDSLAEYGLAPEAELVRIPDGLSMLDAAALPVAYLTAGIALVYQAQVQPGEWVLIQAAGGVVGTAAVQLARLRGARVIATAGSEYKRSRLLELGAEAVFDSGDQTAVVAGVKELTGGAGIDVGLDGAGDRTYQPLLELLANNGRICLYGTVTGLPQGGADRIFVRNGTLHGLVLWTNRHYPAAYGLLRDEVIPALTAGRIRSVAENVFPLDRLGEALALIEGRQQFGKVVITIAAEG